MAEDGLFLEHRTSDFVTQESQFAFYILRGSYFGDWYIQNNVMRAILATPSHGLAVV